MPSQRFRKMDRRYFAAVASGLNSHGTLSALEFAVGAPESKGNKDERATQFMRYLFEQSEHTDDEILVFLDHMFVETTNVDWTTASDEFQQLNRKVLIPRGVVLTDDGYIYGDLPEFTASHQDVPASGVDPSTNGTVNKLPPWPPSTAAPAFTAAVAGPRDPSLVFVVHGRDTRPVQVVRQYLHFLGLRMMTWSQAVNLTGKTQPHTYDIVTAGLRAAGAIIVIFSPDDEARLKPVFAGGKSLPPEGQPRQNVTLEAGMAFAMAPERTIFVQSERVRSISDVEGFNWVSLDGEWDSRKDLLNRLRTAGAAVNQTNENLADDLAGPFKIAPFPSP